MEEVEVVDWVTAGTTVLLPWVPMNFGPGDFDLKWADKIFEERSFGAARVVAGVGMALAAGRSDGGRA